MAHLNVQPRPTPAERAGEHPRIEVDEQLADLASMIEEWVSHYQNWELQLREGYVFGRANNVEAKLIYVNGEQTSTFSFRLEQLEMVDHLGGELVMRFEEKDGICKLARLGTNGLDIELHHILTFT